MIRRSLAFSLSRQYGGQVLRLCSLIVLARLLAPDDFGIFAAALAVFELTQIMARFGITTYWVQERELTAGLRRTAFGVVLVTTALVAASCAAAAALLPNGWLDPRMREVLAVLLLGMALTPFEALLTGVLERSFRFDRLCVVDLGKVVVSVLAAIVLATSGFGYMSLAWAHVSSRIVGTLLAVLLVGRAGWVKPSLDGADRVVRFCAQRTLLALLSRAGESSVPLAASAFQGFAGAGVLNRARRVNDVLTTSLLEGAKPVVLAALSEMRRQDRSLRDAYVRYKVPLLTGLAWPACGFVLVFADAIVMLLLGPGWDQAVVLVQLLCVAGVIRANLLMNVQFYMALDMLGVFLRRQLVMQVVKVAMITLGALHSLEGLAMALVCQSLVSLLVFHGPLKRRLGYETRALALALLRSLAVAAVSIGAALVCALLWRWPSADDLVPLAGVAMVAGLAWLAAIFTFRHQIAQEIMVIAPRLLGRFRGLAERPSVG